MRTSRSNDHHCAWRGATALLALSLAACGGNNPTDPGGTDGSTMGGGSDGGIGGTTDGGGMNRAVGKISIRTWRPDSPQGEIILEGMVDVTRDETRTYFPPPGSLFDRYGPAMGHSIRAADIPLGGLTGPGTENLDRWEPEKRRHIRIRTGKTTPAEVEVEARVPGKTEVWTYRYLVAVLRDGHISSVHWAGGLREGETSLVDDIALPLDINATWRQTAGPNPGMMATLSVETSYPSCEVMGHTRGDGCIRTLFPNTPAVLLGNRIFLHEIGGVVIEGTVSGDRRRVEYDWENEANGSRAHYVLLRE